MEKVITDTDSLHDTSANESTPPVPMPPLVDPANLLPLNTVARIRALMGVMRPKQWTKNAFVFIGLIFAGQAFHILPLERSVIAFLAFCMASSTIYILNDIGDLEKDQQHPVKRFRPLASGRLPVSWAIAFFL